MLQLARKRRLFLILCNHIIRGRDPRRGRWHAYAIDPAKGAASGLWRCRSLSMCCAPAAAVGATERVLVVSPATLEQLQAHYGIQLHYAVQHERRGTAHALLQARPLLEGQVDRVLVLYGADPTMRPQSLEQLVALLDRAGVVGATTTFTPPSPTGYGRIIRDAQGHFVEIVEERNATPAQRQIREVNQGVVAYDAAWLWEHLAQHRAKRADARAVLDRSG